jgi:hypothetical protein
MGEILGADVEAAERLSRLMRESGQSFRDQAANLTSGLDSVQWTGNYASGFRGDWHGTVRDRLFGIAQTLAEAGSRLAEAAQAQRSVSDGGEAAAGAGVAGIAGVGVLAQGQRPRPTRPPVAQLGGTDNGQRYVDYPDGERRVGGDRDWRTNNPGAIMWNDGDTFARDHGAIGRDYRDQYGNHMAVFPDRSTGERAQEALLLDRYADRTIEQMIRRYAPLPVDNAEQYIQNVTGASGLDRGAVINTLDPTQFRALVQAMQAHERENPGTVIRRP